MNDFLRTVPRPVLVMAVLVMGLGLFIYNNPPHTVCDSQRGFFRDSQKGKLYPIQVKTGVRAPVFPKLLENCKLANSPGGCLEYFMALKKLTHDVNAVPSECVAEIANMPEVKATYLGGISMLVRLAWGEEPPEIVAKTGWLESSDLALFCELQQVAFRSLEEEEWNQNRNATMGKLRGVEGMQTEEIWQRSLYSLRCESYQ